MVDLLAELRTIINMGMLALLISLVALYMAIYYYRKHK
ncbi:hypothetical protein ES708_02593 [subsurface metagenome]